MSEMLTKLDSDGVIGVIGIVGGLLACVVIALAAAWQKVHRIDATFALKQDMLNRGMSAEDIRIVLDAGSGKTHWWSCCR